MLPASRGLAVVSERGASRPFTRPLHAVGSASRRDEIPKTGCPVTCGSGREPRSWPLRCQGCLIMSNEKRFVLFIVLMFLWMMGFPYVMRLLGLSSGAQEAAGRRPAAAVEAGEEGRAGRRQGEGAGQGRAAAKGEEPAKKAEAPAGRRRAPRSPDVDLVDGVGAGARLGDRSPRRAAIGSRPS